MPTSNPLDILLERDRWATGQILLACEKLDDGRFGQQFDIGPGSLPATITHILGAMKSWSDTLAERPLGARIDQNGVQYSPTQLLRMLDDVAAEFSTIAKGQPIDRLVTRAREGKVYKFTRGAIVIHVATHGIHHRAQCLNMLRKLGVSPLPQSSVIEWARTADSSPE